jgi:E3 ubiquitin-protein ligase listerin
VVVLPCRDTRPSLSSFPRSRLRLVSTFYPLILLTQVLALPQILLHSDSGVPASPFFSSFWAAVDGRALNALDRTTASAAFLSSLLECTALLARRIRNAREKAGNSGYGEDAEKELVRAQYSRVWEECSSRRLKVQEKVAGELVAKSLVRLNEIDAGICVHLSSCEVLKQIFVGGRSV